MAKTISVALKTLLSSATSLLGCDLYTIILSTGAIAYYTSADVNIVYGGHTFLSPAVPGTGDTVPGFVRGDIKLSIGLAAEELEVDLLYDSATLFQSVSPGSFAIGGGFDGARIIVDKLLTDSFTDTSRGVVNLYDGIVSSIEIGSNRIALTVSNELLRLANTFPRNYYLPSCNHALFDLNCGLSAAAFKISCTAGSGNTVSHINTSTGQADTWFALGYIVCTSGPNNGQKRMVKKYATGDFDLLYPLPFVPAPGDTFDAYPGCDKTQTMCKNKFNNLGRIKAYPYVPTPETIEMGSNSQNPGNTGGGGGGGIKNGGPGGQNTNFKQN